VVVSNGYINEKPLSDLIPYIDAFNIDIKAFTDEFYRKQTKSSLKPVLNTIRQIHSAGKHLELTNLIIPGLNDNPEIFKELLNEIIKISGKNTVLHLSRYFPNYKMKRNETPHDTMMNLFHIAEQFLNYVYIGNMINTEGNNTYCPNCGELLIIRNRYMSRLIGITNSKCDKCNLKIPIVN
jgi:pyruvate formate lyase activating enzyme